MVVLNHGRLGLWVPAFAGTTLQFVAGVRIAHPPKQKRQRSSRRRSHLMRFGPPEAGRSNSARLAVSGR